MSYDSPEPWSDSPFAPQIPYVVYFEEKANLSGNVIGAIFYGIVIVLFFRCIGALLGPVNRTRGGIKWPLLTHTVAMFACATINTAITFEAQSNSYVDNRRFPGGDGLPPGPFAYQFFIYSDATVILPQVMFFLGQLLADGLLLYRCSIIYLTNYWAVALPFLIYLATIPIGIVYLYQTFRPDRDFLDQTPVLNFGTSYYSLSFSLSIILTLMIIVRLFLHNRKVKRSMGVRADTSGLYKAIVTMVVESYALYALNCLLLIGTWGAFNPAQNIFFPIIAETQVIAPLLIVLRVADRGALTIDSIASGKADTIRFMSQGKSAEDEWTFSGRNPTASMTTSGGIPGEPSVGASIIAEEVEL